MNGSAGRDYSGCGYRYTLSAANGGLGFYLSGDGTKNWKEPAPEPAEAYRNGYGLLQGKIRY